MLPEIKAWYGEYVFGDAEMHNSRSVMRFFDNGKFNAYLDNARETSLIDDILMKTPLKSISALEDIADFKTASKPSLRFLSKHPLEKDEDSVFSLLLAMGYLKAVLPNPDLNEDGQEAEVSLPNKEMALRFSKLLRG
jgi:hypothetical protein